MLVSHLGAAVAAADRLFHLIYRGFSCIDFSNPSHIHYPYTGLEWELRKCLPRARPPSPPLGAGYPHRDYGDGARVMTRPTMMTAKHGVGVFPSCCLSKGFHVVRASRMASVFDRLFVFSLDRRLTYQHAARTREGHRRTQVSSRRWLVYEMMVRLEETQSAGQRIQRGSAWVFGWHALSQASALLCSFFFFFSCGIL